MKKNKLIIAGLLLIYVLFVTVQVQGSEEKLVVDEILILGVSRTQKEVIYNQLPFAEGDCWQKEYREWAIQRLATLNIFTYEPLQLVTQPLDEERLRVIIRVADPSLLYLDPAEFLFISLMGLTSNQLGLTFYNPWGTGHNISTTVNWSDNYSYGVRVSKPFLSGRLTLSGHQYRNDTFHYQSEGWLAGINHRYWWNENLRTTTGISLQTVEFDQQHQQLLIPKISVFHQGLVHSKTELQYGLSLNKEQASFSKINTVLYRPGKNLLNLVRLGYAAETTPANKQFVVGGFGSLPLRAEPRGILVNGYFLTTAEYHYSLNPSLKLIGFVDGGWLKSKKPDTIINLGAGLSMDTPLGLPLRFDAAINPVSKDWRWNIGFEFSFNPPI